MKSTRLWGYSMADRILIEDVISNVRYDEGAYYGTLQKTFQEYADALSDYASDYSEVKVQLVGLDYFTTDGISNLNITNNYVSFMFTFYDEGVGMGAYQVSIDSSSGTIYIGDGNLESGWTLKLYVEEEEQEQEFLDKIGFIHFWNNLKTYITNLINTSISTKQDTLVSGTNIKTINNQTLLDSGNINIQTGVQMEVGVEKWYGTWRFQNVTYQVYTKTIFIDALPSSAGITTYDHGISNIKQILGVYGFGTNGFVLNAPRQVTSDNIAIYQVSKSETNKTFSIEVGKNRSNMGAYVTLIYAKNN